MKLIISIKEARKIMGRESEKYTDEEMEQMILDLDWLAKIALEQAKQQRLRKASKKPL